MGSGEGGGEGGIQRGVDVFEMGRGEFGRIGADACEERFVGHFAEGKAKCEGRDGHDGRAMEGAGQDSRELCVGDGAGGGEIDGAGEGWGLKKEEYGGDGVVEADPAHPLLAGAERAAEAEAEDRKHFGERAMAPTDDDAKAEMNDANSGLYGRLGGGLPLPADIGEEAGTGSG